MDKQCTKCEENKKTADFYFRKDSNKYRLECKQCFNLIKKQQYSLKKKTTTYSREYYLSNKDRINKSSRAWAKRNPEKVKTYTRKYIDGHREKVRESHNKYCKERSKIDINFKLICTLRKRMVKFVRSTQGSTLENLGCDLVFFKQYLELKFQKDMSWDNYGKWHIDHIKPLSKFNLTNAVELKQACHYTNLQPLWAIDNLKKGSKHKELSNV